MIFHKVRFKNILGFGNYFTEIQLDKNDITIVTGENGAGKSSMLIDVLCFALYGQVFRNINKNQYINSITKKELLVELYFSIGQDDYKIIRGMKPDIFDIYLNDKIIPQNTNKYGYQDYLESNIIRCGIKTFKQIVVLGSNSYTPFLSLDKKDRRIVVENILDLEIFSIMNAIIKKDQVLLEETIKNEETKKNIINEKIKIINSAMLRNQENIDKEAQKYLDKIIELQKEIEQRSTEFKILLPETNVEQSKADLKDFKERYGDLKDKLTKCRINLDRLYSEKLFYEHTEECPTCHQNLDKDFVKKLILEKETEIQKYNADKEIIVNSINILEKTIMTIISKVENYENNIQFNKNIQQKITSLQSNILMYQNLYTSKKEEVLVINEQDLIYLNADLMDINKHLNELYGERNIQQIILKILKDDGGKAEIVHKYISDLNDLINKFLIDMDFFVQFYLDENFNEIIKSRYRDEFSYNSFSDGQKLRIDLAILFAWRELAKRRNSVSFNVLIFDEVLSGSLSAKGISEFIDILKIQNNTNIFLITHGENGMDRIDNMIKVEMLQGFSRVKD